MYSTLRVRFRRSIALTAASTLLAAGWGVALAAAPSSAADDGPPPVPVGRWQFDEGSGGTAADSAGGHDAVLTGGAGWADGVQGPSSLQTNGSGAYADTGASVIDTARSFTVSAWVKLTTIGGYQTVVSVDGAQVSGFFLGLRDDTKRFAFVKLPSDAPVGAPAFPSATFDPVAGQWYQLTGVHDAAASTLALYVNGQLQSTTAAPAEWSASGPLVIGRGRFAGNPVDFVNGSIDDVRAYQAALTAAQVGQLATNGSWRLDEGSGTTAADDSPNGFTGTLTGGAGWTPGVVGPSAATFDGTSGFIDVPSPVVNTAQSFSVAAWVRADATGFRTAVSVDGAQVSGFYLQQRGDGRFAFTKLASDSTAAAAAVAEASTSVRPGEWYSLVGVYDSVAGTVTLYVNGTRAATASTSGTWRATGHLAIGRGRYAGAPADFWAGAIDDVRTYPFPLDTSAATALATSGAWHFDEGTGTVAHDASPNRADGRLRSASWTTGASGGGVALTGSGDVTMGDQPALDLGTGSASISAWFRSNSVAEQNILAKGVRTNAASGYKLKLQQGRVYARIGGGSGRIVVRTTDASYADGQWHPVSLVLDRAAARLQLFVDGEPAQIERDTGSCGTSAGATALDVSGCTSASGDSDAPFTVGSLSGDAPRLVGAVDEVQVVRYPLTAGQVSVLSGANLLSVDASDVRATTRSTTYGGILEDISHSVEGGLYAELVRNRTFKESYQPGSGPGAGPVPYWSLREDGGADGTMAIDTGTPLNAALDRSLKLHVNSLPAGARLGAANVGYYGVSVTPDTKYKGSLYVRSDRAFTGTLRLSLAKPDGTVLASATSTQTVGTGWTKRFFTLTTPAGLAASTDNVVVASLVGTGATLGNRDVFLQQVSLFPPTFKSRPNGVRRDLGAKLAALHLGLFRVPGGNYLEGNTLETRFDWKRTVGPVETRPGHQNTAWGYWSTDGFGLLDYLRLAEDIGAQPDLALFAGYTLNGQHVSEADYQQYVDDALDEIQYAIGDPSTRWGAQRAADGHPAPFDLKYVEVGNEDWFDASGSYAWRFTRMQDAIHAAYPQLKVIATTGGYQGGAASATSTGTTPDVWDDHYYNPASWFVENASRYDRADRGGPQVLVGEYGAIDGSNTGTLRAAVGEAAFLTGIERNSDIVIGSMYAPVIVHEDQPNWPTNLIGIDAGSSYGSPSYWVQRMFSTNLGHQVLGSRLAGAQAVQQVVTKTVSDGATTFYVKLVNSTRTLQSVRLSFTDISSIDPTGTITTLTGDPGAQNSLAHPLAVAPTTGQLTGLGRTTRLVLPASSVTVLRVTGH